MEIVNNISQELKAWAPYLSTLVKQSPFKVPDNYFDDLASQTLALYSEQIMLESEAPKLVSIPKVQPFSSNNANFFEAMHSNIMATVLGDDAITSEKAVDIEAIKNKNTFTVPNNYFAQLHSNIISRMNDLSEDNTVDTQLIDTIAREQTPYTLPKKYFAQAQTDLMTRLQLLQEDEAVSSKLLVQLKEQPTFTVPTGYFAALHQSVTDKALSDSLPKLESGFSIPNNYFEQLQKSILEKTTKQKGESPVQGGKSVPMTPNARTKGFWQRNARYIVSAAAAIVLVFVGSLIFNPQEQGCYASSYPSTMEEVECLASQMNLADLQLYVEDNIDEFSAVMDEMETSDVAINIEGAGIGDIELNEELMEQLDLSIEDLEELLNE